MKKLLLTGATGFLGSNLLRRILPHYEVSILVRSSSKFFRIEDLLPQLRVVNAEETGITALLQEARPDIIVHCATDYGRKDVPLEQIIEANLLLPLRLLAGAKEAGVERFINTDTFLDKRINHYSLSKKQFREWLRSFSGNLLCINMVLEHFYGPYDDKTKFVSHVIDHLLTDSPSIDLTKGEQKRNFIFIDDVVDAFALILRHSFDAPAGFHEFLIGSDETISIRDFVEKLQQLSGNTSTHLNFGALPYRPNEIMDSSVDTSAMKALGWTPQTPLDKGLQQTIRMEKQKKL